MVILIALAALFALFFITKKHPGPAHLAVIAGLSVYEMFGKQAASWLSGVLPKNIDLFWIETGIYLALILVFPLILYLRSARGGLGGIIHLIDAAVFAVVLTALLAPVLAHFFAFDTLSTNLAGIIEKYEGWVVLVGIVSAYIDILIYRSHPRF